MGIDTSKTGERGKLVSGRLEISSDDQADHEGNVVAGDRWSVECSVTVLPSPGMLQAIGWEGAPTAPLSVSGRRGQAATGQFSIRNTGETPVGFQVLPAAEGIEGLQITPAEGMVAPKQEVPIALSVPTAGLAAGAYPAGVIVRSPTLQTLTVPIALNVLSPLGYLKARLGGGK